MKRVFILMMSICAVFMGCSKANEPQGDAGWGGNTEPKENLVVMLSLIHISEPTRP